MTLDRHDPALGRRKDSKMAQPTFPTGVDIAGVDAALARDKARVKAETTSRFINIVDYLATIPTEIDWLCEPLCYFGGVTLLAGPPKKGKSTLIAQLVRARETGEEFFGVPIPKGPVALATEEGGMATRHKYGSRKGLAILDRRMAAKAEMSFPQLLHDLYLWAREQGPKSVVVIDTFALWSSIEDENNSAAITQVISDLCVFAQEVDGVVILIDHTRKGDGSSGGGDEIRGSSAKTATVDTFATLFPASTGMDSDRFLEVSGRLISPQKLRLKYDSTTSTYTIEESGLADVQDMLLWLKVLMPKGIGGGTSRAELAGLWGINPRTVQKRLGKLMQNDLLFVGQGKRSGTNTTVYWSMAPAATHPAGEEDNELFN